MSFLEKLKLDVAQDEKEEEIQQETAPKRKRGRPRKNPQTQPQSETESEMEQKSAASEKIQRPKVEKVAPRFEEREEGELTIDVYETANDLVVQSPLAGVKADELNIYLEDDMLVIKGERLRPGEEDKKMIIQECYWGPFSRRVILPMEVEGNKINASLERGILTIRIPKAEKRGKKKISVQESEE